MYRREFLRATGDRSFASLLPTTPAGPKPSVGILQTALIFDVQQFGAKGDGVTLESLVIHRAIEASTSAGGGTIMFQLCAPAKSAAFSQQRTRSFRIFGRRDDPDRKVESIDGAQR